MLKEIFGLKGKAYDRIMPALFAYQFHRIDMERFIEYVGDREEGTRLKDIARANGYVIKNCKLYAWACHTSRREGADMPKAKAFGVDASDAALLKRLNLRHLDIETKEKYRSYELKEFDLQVNRIMGSRDLRDYIGRFVSKKMKFLMDSYGHTRDDIEGYLREMAVVALYRQYPRFYSDLHMLNVAKTQIHNKGQSFITSSTAKSRQRLLATSDGGFEAVHVDISTLSDVAAPPQYGAELRDKLKALSQIESFLPERTKEFLMCAMGQPHEGFSEFLQRDNSEAAEDMPYARYMSKLQRYFNTDEARVERLFANIKRKVYETSSL